MIVDTSVAPSSSRVRAGAAVGGPVHGPTGGPPWVIVCGGAHRRGAMDRANLELAAHLVGAGREVTVVAHDVEPSLVGAARVRRVARPAGSVLAGEILLGRAGRRAARAALRRDEAARVLVNGGNCAWPGANWVHSVHHAWPRAAAGAPLAWRLKEAIAERWFRHREARALGRARLVIANSRRTRRDLIERLAVPPDRIAVVYPGSDPAHVPPIPEARRAARAALGVSDARPIVAFVGALGADDTKGLGTLLAAWARLARRPEWQGLLAIAGAGPRLAQWRAEAIRHGLDASVCFLGFTRDVPPLLAAADLLVAPSRYEAYGVAVHEALCCGLPAIVSAHAGVAERCVPELAPLLLDDPSDDEALADRIVGWQRSADRWREAAAAIGERLRLWTWSRMAAEIADLVERA
jgi:glycosyltransferase involved in cell wall biosynthesis